MYGRTFAPVIVFHATELSVAEQVISGNAALSPSENAWDWLGHGIYFWENSPSRAWDYADLSEHSGIQELVDAAAVLEGIYNILGESLPTNQPLKPGGEAMLRELDCAVFCALHEMRARDELPRYDTVRAVFFEGEPAYAGTTFQQQTHVQIAVLNQNCIKGYFWPRDAVAKPYVVTPSVSGHYALRSRRAKKGGASKST